MIGNFLFCITIIIFSFSSNAYCQSKDFEDTEARKDEINKLTVLYNAYQKNIDSNLTKFKEVTVSEDDQGNHGTTVVYFHDGKSIVKIVETSQGEESGSQTSYYLNNNKLLLTIKDYGYSVGEESFTAIKKEYFDNKENLLITCSSEKKENRVFNYLDNIYEENQKEELNKGKSIIKEVLKAFQDTKKKKGIKK